MDDDLGVSGALAVIHEAVRTGKLRPGHRIVIEGVGGGFTWGAALIDF